MTNDSKQARTMSATHKAALAQGRTQGRAVRVYLEALQASRPKRGRKRSREALEARLAKVEAEIPEAGAVQRLQLVQERMDLEAALRAAEEPAVDLDALEQGFVDAAKDYSERKGISYAAWREAGVPAATLKAAGISRGR